MNLNYYYLFEAAHAVMGPARAMSDMVRLYYRNPINPLSQTAVGRNIAAACEMFERATRRYGKPAFELPTTTVDGKEVAVAEAVVWSKPFCQLLHFRRALPPSAKRQPNLLIVAPMSGHYATLLRGTVEAFLPHFEVYITDWTDARVVPLSDGRFDFDDYVDYVTAMMQHLGPDTHVLAVCQPAVPVAVAVALMEAAGDPLAPRSMTLMGGPIDTRESPTAVNKLAKERGIDWFRKNCIATVPFPHAGVMREVYPGFLQLSGFMAMNIDRHVEAHLEMFNHLMQGDGDSAEKHRDFYDEYMAVMDLTAEFYLQTVDAVFVRHALPKGEMTHRGRPVSLAAIRRVGLMTVEGEKDDISGVGQTRATHALCTNLPKDKQRYHLQLGVGHYGVFNGSRFRREIAPAVVAFTREMDEAAARPQPVAANTNRVQTPEPAQAEAAPAKVAQAAAVPARPTSVAKSAPVTKSASVAKARPVAKTPAGPAVAVVQAKAAPAPVKPAPAPVEPAPAVVETPAAAPARPRLAAPLARRPRGG